MPSLYVAAWQNLTQLVPPAGLVLTAVEEDYEFGTSRETSQTLSRKQLFFDYIEARWTKKGERLAALAEIASLDDFVSDLLDTLNDGFGFHPVALEPAEAANNRRRERERARLEIAAREIAARHNVAVGSLDFIRACFDELERFASYREGMREDGLCIGYGVTSEQWFDEFNASQGDSGNVRDVLAWLETECPLLVAQAREARLRGDADALEI